MAASSTSPSSPISRLTSPRKFLPAAKIYVAGHRGLVGSAIVRRLKAEGFNNLILRSHAELDLCDPRAVEGFFAAERPEYVFLAAARVGGILANSIYPADFIRDNLEIQTHVIGAARRFGVKHLLFLGSSCIYPRLAPQPMHEEHLLTGPLEETNQWYAVAKIAGIKMCQAYARQYGFDAVCLMPTNLYGPNDNFDLQDSHVLPALIRKFHLAKLAVSGDLDGIRRDEDCFGRIPDDILQHLGIKRDSDSMPEAASPRSSALSPQSFSFPRLPSHAPRSLSDLGGSSRAGGGARQKSTDFEVHSGYYGTRKPCFFDRHPCRAVDFIQVRQTPRVVLWGTGAPRREFLHVDDLAAACLFLMKRGGGSEGAGTKDTLPGARPSDLLFNVGTGRDIPVRELAAMVREIVGFSGAVIWDDSKPDGTPRKLLDVSRLTQLGWKAEIGLREGIEAVYRWYLATLEGGD